MENLSPELQAVVTMFQDAWANGKWLAVIPLIFAAAVMLGMSGYLDQLESSVDSGYESSAMTTDEEADQSVIAGEEDVQSADDAAEPVDSPEE